MNTEVESSQSDSYVFKKTRKKKRTQKKHNLFRIKVFETTVIYRTFLDFNHFKAIHTSSRKLEKNALKRKHNLFRIKVFENNVIYRTF